MTVLLNQGDGTVRIYGQFLTGSGPRSITARDVNGDGRSDLAVANYESRSVSLFFQTCIP